MSKTSRTFIVAEGKDVDPTFYSRLARSHTDPRVRSAKIMPVSEVTRDLKKSLGVGRRAVLALHAELKDLGLLSRSNAQSSSIIMCAVDADLAADSQLLAGELHVMVTTARDVEAEVFARARLDRALESLTYSDALAAQQLSRSMGDWLDLFLDRYRVWIWLGLVSQSCESAPKVSWMGKSLINDANGELEDASEERFSAMLEAAFDSKEQYLGVAAAAIESLLSLFRSGGAARLIKGKWLADGVVHRLLEVHPELVGRRSQMRQVATVVFLEALDFEDDWTAPYKQKLGEPFRMLDAASSAAPTDSLVR